MSTVSELEACANNLKSDIWVSALPGTFVHGARALLHVEKDMHDDDARRRVRSAFTVGAERSFDQDPRFGLIVLAEIASRALSPAVNDPGTAISVVGRLVRILANWKYGPEPDIQYQSVFVPPVSSADLLDDAFRPIIRDGASTVEVQIRLQKALQAWPPCRKTLFALPRRP